LLPPGQIIVLKDLRRCHPHVLCRHHLAFLPAGSDERSFGKKICPPEEPSRALMDGKDRLIGEELFGDAGNVEMVLQVTGPVLGFQPLEMAPADHP